MQRFGEPQPDQCLFPFGSPQPTCPDRPVTDVSPGWDLVQSLAQVSCRLHDLRHIFCTRLAEAGRIGIHYARADGPYEPAMLERYSHIRMAAKRDAVAAITLRPKIESSVVVPVVNSRILVQ